MSLIKPQTALRCHSIGRALGQFADDAVTVLFPIQAEKIQLHAISTLRKGGAGGLALARGYSGLADIVFQSSSRRAPEALQHLRTAVAVRYKRAGLWSCPPGIIVHALGIPAGYQPLIFRCSDVHLSNLTCTSSCQVRPDAAPRDGVKHPRAVQTRCLVA